jgi:glycosyltransferase involved in cell wall biosynthesis
MTETIHVGFLGGTELPGNVRTLLCNLRRLLRSSDQQFDCDLLVSENVDTLDGFRTFRIAHDSVETARERLRKLWKATEQYANSEHPDVLMQVTRFPTHGSAIALAGWRTDTPTITRLAGDNFREYKFSTGISEKLRTFLLKNVIAMAAVHIPESVVVLGPSGRRDIERRLRPGDIREIPQPVDQSRFNPGNASELRASMDVASDDRLLLTVGRVSRRKGVEMIRRVAPSCDGTWVVLGDGPMREKLADTPDVRAPGRVPHDQIVDYYRAANLYVHPSLHEGLPNVLLEATACGTPCIARDVGECASVAVETFTEEAGLRVALDRSYDPVALDERFQEDRLADQYATLLTEVSR